MTDDFVGIDGEDSFAVGGAHSGETVDGGATDSGIAVARETAQISLQLQPVVRALVRRTIGRREGRQKAQRRFPSRAVAAARRLLGHFSHALDFVRADQRLGHHPFEQGQDGEVERAVGARQRLVAALGQLLGDENGGMLLLLGRSRALDSRANHLQGESGGVERASAVHDADQSTTHPHQFVVFDRLREFDGDVA